MNILLSYHVELCWSDGGTPWADVWLMRSDFVLPEDLHKLKAEAIRQFAHDDSSDVYVSCVRCEGPVGVVDLPSALWELDRANSVRDAALQVYEEATVSVDVAQDAVESFQ